MGKRNWNRDKLIIMQKILVAGSIKNFSKLQYQEVTTELDGMVYLQTLNIIIDGKTIEKIRFEGSGIAYEKGIGERIVLQKLTEYLTLHKDNKKTKGTKRKQRVSKKAANKAASDLLNNLGL